MISDFRNRITINRYDIAEQSLTGGLLNSPPAATTTKWAKVESRSGNVSFDSAQREWTYDYKITVRYTPSFVERSNDEVVYQDKRMLIKSVSFEEEGKLRFVILRCTVNE